MAEEDKGFTVRDKRSLDETGELKGDEAQKEATEDKEEAIGDKDRDGGVKGPPLPEVNFNSLIFSLSSSALLHIGEIADPQTNEKKTDLPLAKHTIDTIAMLQEKTKGNLNDEEKNFLDSILTDLRLRYVKAAG
jgi:hypothetical protein